MLTNFAHNMRRIARPLRFTPDERRLPPAFWELSNAWPVRTRTLVIEMITSTLVASARSNPSRTLSPNSIISTSAGSMTPLKANRSCMPNVARPDR